MSTGSKKKGPDLPEKDAARDLRKFERLSEEKKAAVRLQEDTDKTSGPAANQVRAKVKAAILDGGTA